MDLAFELEMVTSAPIIFLTFDQAAIKGKIVNDVWSKNHGTIKGAPKSVKGKFSQALSFDGKKDLVEIPHHHGPFPELPSVSSARRRCFTAC